MIFIFVAVLCIKYALSSSEAKPLVIGADFGTESCRVGLFNGKNGELIKSKSRTYKTLFPVAGYAEQVPSDWWDAFGQSCMELFHEVSAIPDLDLKDIVAMTIDTTACSVVALDKDMVPLRNCLLWCDARSHQQTKEIFEKCFGDGSMKINCDGNGPLSAEWMIPKALWIKQNEPDIWNRAQYICEKQDWLNFKLTNTYVSSGCNVAARWHWDASKAAKSQNEGRPLSMLKKIGMEDILQKWPQRCVRMGECVGPLTDSAANHMGLDQFDVQNIQVYQGGPDAYVGMVGLGVVSTESIGLITGSSHLHLVVNENFETSDGVWGSYKDAPFEGLLFSEGGQSSTGSALNWFRKLISDGSNELVAYEDLDGEADKLPVGSNGVLCLETFQGSRTPVTDPMARGAIVGLSLNHKRGHVWRSMMEGIVLGTKSILDRFLDNRRNQHSKKEIVVGGGATRSKVFLQMHADATNLTIVTCEQDNSPLLGCAIVASVGHGLHTLEASESMQSKVQRAVHRMVRVTKRILPRPCQAEQYAQLHLVYKSLTNALRPINHKLVKLASSGNTINEKDNQDASRIFDASSKTFIVPSLLSCDHGYLASEAIICEEDAKCEWVHIDLCDGSDLAQYSFTIGPASIAAIHAAAPNLKLDIHMIYNNPSQMIKRLGEAGASRITLQYEQILDLSHGDILRLMTVLCSEIKSNGMTCGICIKPSTDVAVLQELDPLLQGENPIIEFVDILAVDPGVGGQKFNGTVLNKIDWVKSRYPLLRFIGIDGGIDESNCIQVLNRGANFVIAGTSIFGKNRKNSDRGDSVVRSINRFRDIIAARGH